MNAYAEQQFRAKIDAALATIRRVLDNTRSPETPADVPHKYDDKFLLAEFVTQVAMASVFQCLELVGLQADGVARMVEWAKTRSVSLRFSAQETCRFLREETRKVESPEHVTEVKGIFGTTTRSEKVLVSVTEYFWRFDFSYELVAYQGNAPENAIALFTHSGGIEIKTGAKQTPRPASVIRPPLDVDVSWLFGQLDEQGRPRFAIDRASADCHTPRRNEEIDRALAVLAELHGWCERVVAYFRKDLFSAADHGRDLAAIDAAGLFVPVVPLFENGEHSEGEGLIPPSYSTAFLEEQRRSLTEKRRALATAFPNDGHVVSVVEAGLVVMLSHLALVIERHAHAVDHVEQMLKNQLVAAIGKVITPADFTAYMDFHHRKLVREAYRPRPFSYAIRRPDHDPEGVVSIEAERGKSMPEPVATTVAGTRSDRSMTFALDASTRASFTGDRYLHSWITHQFSGQRPLVAHLVARARQFSSFILLVGRIASADVFEPRFGVLVQNKDLLKIPLMLEEIPTPKQFRDAIESLSPEQQRFARAFRGMQLESTLFGVCVIQVKPQLEKLLKLPSDSLTKEIKLTQQLLELFAEYQIPSDLLSYDGADDAPVADKLARVKEYTARMFEMIDHSKRRELEEEQEREAFRLAEMNRSPQTPLRPPPGIAYGPPPGAAFGPASAAEAAPAPRAMRAKHSPQMALSAPAPVVASAPASGGAPPPVATRRSPAAGKSAARPMPAERGGMPSAGDGGDQGGDARDFTKVPGELDRRFEELDDDAALHATVIHPGDVWARTARKGLLGDPEDEVLEADGQEAEKHKTFDLLDALTKSGALAIDDASLHVVIAATHRFDKTLVDTVIQDNVNPIEKVERSLMIASTTIFGLPAAELLADDQRARFFATSPKLEATGKPALGKGDEPSGAV